MYSVSLGCILFLQNFYKDFVLCYSMKKGVMITFGMLLISVMLIWIVSAEWTEVWSINGQRVCNEFADAWVDGDGFFLKSENWDAEGMNPRSGYNSVVDCDGTGIILNSAGPNYPNFIVKQDWVRVNPDTRVIIGITISDKTDCSAGLI